MVQVRELEVDDARDLTCSRNEQVPGREVPMDWQRTPLTKRIVQALMQVVQIPDDFLYVSQERRLEGIYGLRAACNIGESAQ